MKSDFHLEASLFQLLEEVSRHPSIQPQALAAKLNLGRAAVRSQTRRLSRAGLVIPSGDRRGTSLNPDYGCLVGIDMGASHLHFALADFTGEIVADTKEKVRPEDGPRRTISQIKKGIHRLIPAGKRNTLRAVAMAVPSAVDPRTGLVLMANNLQGWKNINLKRELEKEFRLPVCIDNDANMAAIGEHWRGVARGLDNFVFIALGTGIGSGIFVNGHLYAGRTGAAGELQFLQVEWPRWNEDFGVTGYFESYASGQGIATLGRKLMKPRPGGRSAGLAETRDAYFVFDAFRRGNRQARKTLETIFTILGVGVANIVGVLDPDLIVLGGGISRGAPEFMLQTVARVAKRIQPNCPPIRISELGVQAQTCGAIYSSLMAACKAAVRKTR
ncbi:MAG: ROK family transcriptional regulator [Acidobacteria bacterium]|nr:MAG: ROK family transcriptional regulator [Acidobacteriota bacterium]